MRGSQESTRQRGAGLSNIKTKTEADQKSDQLDQTFDDLSVFVCGYGPELLTRGMPALMANTAILECLKKQRRKIELADKIFELMLCFSVGMSFLSEARVKSSLEEYRDA